MQWIGYPIKQVKERQISGSTLKAFSITTEVNPVPNEIPLHAHSDSYYKNNKRKITSVGENMEKLEFLHITGENVKYYGK